MMNPLFFHVLLALADRDMAATALTEQIGHDTEAMFGVPESTFYAALSWLVKQDWIVKHGAGRGARYHLTALGRQQLQHDAVRIKRAARLLRERL